MENYKFVLFVNGEPVDYDDCSDPLLKEVYDNNCPLKISEEESCYGGSEVADFDDFCDWLDYHAGAYATCVRICNKNNELLDFFVINSFYTGVIPFFYTQRRIDLIVVVCRVLCLTRNFVRHKT